MRRSTVVMRLATHLGLIEPGKSAQQYLQRYRTEGGGKPFEEWFVQAVNAGEDKLKDIKDQYAGLSFTCQDCATKYPASAMMDEDLTCSSCGSDSFNVDGVGGDKSKKAGVMTPAPVSPNEAGAAAAGAEAAAKPTPTDVGNIGHGDVVRPDNPDEVLLEVETTHELSKQRVGDPHVLSASGSGGDTAGVVSPEAAAAQAPAAPAPVAPAAAAQPAPAQPQTAAATATPAPVGGGAPEVVADLRRPLQPGQVIANAEILGRAGEGGMGTVYKARHKGLGRLVAIKVITPDRLASQQALLRFRREAQVLASFDHPHIVQVYDYGEIGGGAYLTMQWIDGKGLEKMLEKAGKLPMKDALRIILATAKALVAAHGDGIIHRDLKPDNILVQKDGTPKLADFGLARVDQANAQKLTAGDAMLGTPLYMAPEQTDGEASALSDIYSLGCTLFHMLAGRPPFVGSTVWDLLRRHVQEPFPSLKKYLPEAPDSLDALLQRMGAKKPKDRPASAKEVVEQLEMVLAELDGGAAAAGAAGALATVIGAAPVATPVDEFALPVARSWRDWQARKTTSQALQAAISYFDSVVQTVVSMLASPVFRQPALKADLTKAIQPIGAQMRSSGWATAWRNLIRLHEEKKTPGEPVNECKLFSLSRRQGKALQALVAEMQGMASKMPPIQQPLASLKFPMSFANWAQIAAYVIDVARTAQGDALLSLQDFAQKLGAALDELLFENPGFPKAKVVWAELGDQLPDGRIAITLQRLNGPHPHPASRVETKPGSPLSAAIDPERGSGLFVQFDANLLPLEPLLCFDDGEFYALSGCEMDAIEFRSPSTGHRLLMPPSKRPALFGQLYPQGFVKPPIVVVTQPASDLKTDVDRLPNDLGATLIQAASIAKTEAQRSVSLSTQAAGRALGLVLKQPAASLDRAVELLRKVSPPIAPTLVECMTNIVRRANQFGADGPQLGLFAAVRLALWASGSPTGVLNFNPKECVDSLLGQAVIEQPPSAEEQPASEGGVLMTMPRGARKRSGTPAPIQIQLSTLACVGKHAKLPKPRVTKAITIRCLGPVRQIGALTFNVPNQCGRNPDCALQINSPFVSRYHMELSLGDKGEFVAVHGSPTNSSSINGCKLVTGERHPLRAGDVFFVDTEGFMVTG